MGYLFCRVKTTSFGLNKFLHRLLIKFKDMAAEIAAKGYKVEVNCVVCDYL